MVFYSSCNNRAKLRRSLPNAYGRAWAATRNGIGFFIKFWTRPESRPTTPGTQLLPEVALYTVFILSLRDKIGSFQKVDIGRKRLAGIYLANAMARQVEELIYGYEYT